MIVTVRLNGTTTNPFHKMGLKCNPFPPIPKYEYVTANHILRDLGSEPITDLDNLRNRLKGCSAEFVELCCQQFEKGKMIEFQIRFPD
jgi:hypothetical protein